MDKVNGNNKSSQSNGFATVAASSGSALVPAGIRNMGTLVLASKGGGKSRAMGRLLVKGDVLAGIPGLVIDPAGGTIDNLLDSLLRLPAARQKEVWPRIIYIDAGNPDRVVPFPLYYRVKASESAFDIASRYLEVVQMLDPDLQTASIEGWNALYTAGIHSGIAMAALGGQITEVQDLLDHPKAYRERIRALVASGAVERDSAKWLLEELPGLKPDLRARRIASLQHKTTYFSLNRPLKAMFGASTPGIDWHEVVAQRQTVLLDLRNLMNLADQQFLLLWVLHSFLQFVKARGIGRHSPLALTIDEVSLLSTLDARSAKQPFADLIDNLLNIWARQSQIWVTISHQESWQVSDKMRKTLMGCGTRVLGRTSDNEAALLMASHFFPPDPHLVKHREAMYDGEGKIRDSRPVYYSLPEQQSEMAQLLTEVPKFHFFRKRVDGEGGGDLPVEHLDLEDFDKGCYPNDAILAGEVRPALHARSARTVEEVLAEIAERQQRLRNTPPGLRRDNDDGGLENFNGGPDGAFNGTYAGALDGAPEPDSPDAPIEPAIVGGEHYDPEGFVVEPSTN